MPSGRPIRFLRKIRCAIRRSPFLFLDCALPLLRQRNPDGSLKRFYPDTKLVIDAFPRSGNTFATYAFQQAQQKRIRIGHHFHAPAAVAAAAKKNIPILTIIREPDDAVISWVLFGFSPHIEEGYYDYINFYQVVEKYRPRIFVARFESVTEDLGEVIIALNKKYSTHFTSFEHSEQNVRQVFELIETDTLRHAERYGTIAWTRAPKPDDKRSSEKSAMKQRLADPGYRSLRTLAKELFQRLHATADI